MKEQEFQQQISRLTILRAAPDRLGEWWKKVFDMHVPDLERAIDTYLDNEKNKSFPHPKTLQRLCIEARSKRITRNHVTENEDDWTGQRKAEAHWLKVYGEPCSPLPIDWSHEQLAACHVDKSVEDLASDIAKAKAL